MGVGRRVQAGNAVSAIDLLVDDVHALKHALSAARAARTALEPATVAGSASLPAQQQRAIGARGAMESLNTTITRLESELMLARRRLHEAQQAEAQRS